MYITDRLRQVSRARFTERSGPAMNCEISLNHNSVNFQEDNNGSDPDRQLTMHDLVKLLCYHVFRRSVTLAEARGELECAPE